MMKIARDMKRVARLLLCLSLPAACTMEEAVLPELADGKEVRLELSARVHAAGAPESRVLGDDENFPVGDYRFGTWICYSDSLPKFVPSKIGYANLQTDMKVDRDGKQTWKYTFENGRDGTLNVSRGVPVHIYTFYPRPQNGPHATQPDNVPFTSGPTDWMWAMESIAGEDLEGRQTTVSLKFGHAMTCLRIIIKCKYAGSKLTSITLKDKKKRIYTGGTMNLAERKLTLDEGDRTGELKVEYNTPLSTTEKDLYIFMPAVEGYEDGDFTLSFVFDKNPAKTEFSIPKKIKGPDGTDVLIENFETGKRYTYRLTLDNPMIFVPAGVDDSWTTENRDLIL